MKPTPEEQAAAIKAKAWEDAAKYKFEGAQAAHFVIGVLTSQLEFALEKRTRKPRTKAKA